MNTFEVYKRQLEVASREFSDVIEHGQMLRSDLRAGERGLLNLLESVSGYGGGDHESD